MSLIEEILSQIPGDALTNLRRADAMLASWRNLDTNQENINPGSNQPAMVLDRALPIATSHEILPEYDYDVVICGGTLGILLAAALVQQGLKVALLERGILRGREQEWNISRRELDVFVELGLLEQPELEKAIATEYNPARVGFAGGWSVWVENVLNIGVDPVYLLEILKQKFLAMGGKLSENTAFAGAVVHPNGVTVNKQNQNQNNQPLKTRLLIDAMGHFSPITRQARGNKKPDALCMVVGTCAQGFRENSQGDLFLSFTPIEKQCQYFWEAFPAKDGRTTYLFTYFDSEGDRLTLEELFADYLRLLPAYQNIELNQLKFIRALFGFFPSYRQSPLQTPWNFILPVGDSSGSQSPLSFGGFGAMVRHLKRLTNGITEALEVNELSAPALNLLQPYQPNISVTWLFQKTMSVGKNQTVSPTQINDLLATVFIEMEKLGEPVLKPFLQDVIQFSGLTQTLLQTTLNHPLIITKILPQVGLPALLEWMGHYTNLGTYSVLNQLQPLLANWVKTQPKKNQYYWHRRFDAWKYGSGGDFD